MESQPKPATSGTTPAPIDRAMETLTQDELVRLYWNFSHYRDSVCNGVANLTVPEFLKQYGLTQSYLMEGAGAKPSLPETIHVAFRKFPEGDVIALWGRPNERGMISSYQHVGQHGEACGNLINELEPATPGEYYPLREELIRRGYSVMRELSQFSISDPETCETLLCVECVTWEEADALIPADLRHGLTFGECHLGFMETHQTYTVYKLPEQAAEAIAHIRRESKEA